MARLSRIFIPLTVIVAGVFLATGAIKLPNDPVTESADRFWDALYIHGAQVEDHETLGELANASDVVVVGTVASVDYGRRRGSETDGWAHYGHLRLAVDETLRGADLVPSDGIVVEMLLTSDRAFAAMNSKPPGERLIMFLRHKESEAKLLGLPDDQVALERGFFRVVQPEAVVRNRIGRAHPRMAEDRLYGQWSGRPFGDLVAAVRTELDQN
jgi:hypothetical protein